MDERKPDNGVIISHNKWLYAIRNITMHLMNDQVVGESPIFLFIYRF